LRHSFQFEGDKGKRTKEELKKKMFKRKHETQDEEALSASVGEKRTGRIVGGLKWVGPSPPMAPGFFTTKVGGSGASGRGRTMMKKIAYPPKHTRGLKGSRICTI